MHAVRSKRHAEATHHTPRHPVSAGENDEMLDNVAAAEPTVLAEVLVGLFRHDPETSLGAESPCLVALGLDAQRFLGLCHAGGAVMAVDGLVPLGRGERAMRHTLVLDSSEAYLIDILHILKKFASWVGEGVVLRLNVLRTIYLVYIRCKL